LCGEKNRKIGLWATQERREVTLQSGGRLAVLSSTGYSKEPQTFGNFVFLGNLKKCAVTKQIKTVH